MDKYQYNDNGRIIIPNKQELLKLPLDGGELWNRLVFSNSPYLLQHAANPVNWYPWSDEAFLLAKQTNKPIFLSIGYTTCHWCHVMEHESFEDPNVAELMNETFVNIKVDREERPDIDNIYMDATHMINGRGGWPMTVIMTPDQKPFFAGTYFPKSSRGNRIGMLELIPEIKKLWETKKDSILESSNEITKQLVNRNISRNQKNNISYNQILKSAYDNFEKNYDSEFGGFKGSRNKFPKSHDYSFILRHYSKTKDVKALDIVNKSLYAMKYGGMYDQIGFGFHRYSTDPKWLVPHFEKMLYDQAMLIHTYLDAYIVTGDDFYKQTVDEICTYILRDMISDNGGFFSAEDADSEGEEGVFYIWDYSEIKKVLSHDDLLFFTEVLNIKSEGNCRVEGHNTNIPHFTTSLEEFSQKYNLNNNQIKDKFNNCRDKVYNYRKQRVHPQKDDKILTDWNGLAISALARAGYVLNNPEYIKSAEDSADFIINNLRMSDGGLAKSFRNENSNIPGMIEDYSFFIWGLIELYQGTFDNKYIEDAITLSDYQIDKFWDKENHGFFFTASDSEKLIVRNKESYDGAIPSGNSVSAYNYIRLSKILSRSDYEDIAFKTIDAFSSNLKRYSAGYSMMLHAVDFIEGPSYEVIIVGDESLSKEIIHQIQKVQQLNKVIIYKDINKSLNDNFSFLSNYYPHDDGDPHIYICKNYICELPTKDINLAIDILNEH